MCKSLSKELIATLLRQRQCTKAKYIPIRTVYKTSKSKVKLKYVDYIGNDDPYIDRFCARSHVYL